MVNVPAIVGHGSHIRCIVCEANDVQRAEAKRCGVVFAGADVSVREHLHDLIDDFDSAFFRRPSHIEDDAGQTGDVLRQQMDHVRLLHHLHDEEVVMERQVSRHERFADVASSLVPPLDLSRLGR